MENREQIAVIFDELNRAPERRATAGAGGEILFGAILICLTLLFWPELRLLIGLVLHYCGARPW